MSIIDIKQIDNKTWYIITGVVLVAGIIAWNVYGRAVLPDDGRGANAVRTGLDATEAEQHSTTDSIGKAEIGLTEAGNTAHTVTGQLEEARSTNTRIIAGYTESESSLTSSGEVITRLQDRFKHIRERGKQ